MNIYWIIGIIEVALAVLVCSHAVLYKRDSRASTFWVLLILLVPLLGMLFYVLFGINRIQREAPALTSTNENVSGKLTADYFSDLFLPFRRCEAFEILKNGDEAFPKMLDGIDSSKSEILLSTYIFDNDRVGIQFIERLKNAVQRGVKVYVLVDGVGIWYSIPRITSQLKRAGIPYAVFLPSLAPWSTRFLNLRNHRKLLVIDRDRAFIGGINIREGHWLGLSPRSPVRDVHFLMKGEVIDDFVQQFLRDWKFASKETAPLTSLRETPSANLSGFHTSFQGRAVSDGPDLKRPRLASLLLIRIAESKSRLRIVSPYFLPDQIFISALTTAALRGVEIDLVIPAKNNLSWVAWAMRAQAWQFLEYGIKIWETAGAFDHSKIFVADDRCCIVGSSNWDSRSFRLNFELNLEIESAEIAGQLNAVIDDKLQNATRVSLDTLNDRSLPARLRDGLARLFLPVL